MRQMKDSGIEWIGEIPENWEVIKFKYIFSIIGGNGFPEHLQGDETGSIPFCKVSDINGDSVFVSGAANYITPQTLRQNSFNLIPTNSIIMAKIGAALQKNHRKINSTECCIDNNTQALVPIKNSDILYLYYLTKCIDMKWFDNNSTIPSVNNNKLLNFYIPYVSVTEQKAISAHLDKQCAHIDNIIEKTKASIEEYKKLRQAVITQAVTKGVRGDRPMKDSGIEWIGEIPEEWSLIPFRHILKERQEKNSPVKTEERLSLSIDLGVTLYAEKTTNLDRFKEDFEQYKLAHVGDLVMNSMNMIVGATGVSNYYGCVSPVYYTFYDELPDHATAKYCEYIFRSKTMLRVLYSLGKGIYAIVRGDDRVNTCRLKVSKEDLKSIVIPQPSIEEQREIIAYLDSKSAEIESLIAKKEQFLTKLESYKKSMIYEYVTGKKEVPSA